MAGFWIATHQTVTTSPGVSPDDLMAIATPNGPFSNTTDVPSTGPGDIPLSGVQFIGLVIASACTECARLIAIVAAHAKRAAFRLLGLLGLEFMAFSFGCIRASVHFNRQCS
jgi:hypothetical protein